MFGLNFKIIALFAGMALVFAGGFYFYFNYTQRQMAALNQQLAASQAALEIQRETIESMRNDSIAQGETIRELGIRYQAARRLVSDLERTFREDGAGQARDFDNLAASKPGLVENIVNGATERANICLELYSGRDINEYGLSNDELQKTLDECGLSAN